jgi:hypothetical protein
MVRLRALLMVFQTDHLRAHPTDYWAHLMVYLMVFLMVLQTVLQMA